MLLDEVETLAADRLRMSMDANPIDVHRATDAVLAQLDQLAAKYPHLLFIATSNFTRAGAGAFLSPRRPDRKDRHAWPGELAVPFCDPRSRNSPRPFRQRGAFRKEATSSVPPSTASGWTVGAFASW